MFNGPYLITEVNHTIQPGQFQTDFTGVRQGVYDLPSIDNLLQSLNQNLLTQIESAILKKKENVPTKPTTNIDKTALLSQTGNNAAAAVNSCTLSLNTNYVTWGDFVESATIGLTPQELADAIVAKTSDPNLQVLIYMMCYIKTFNKDKFYGYNNNFANVELSVYWGPSTQYFIQKQSSCVSVSNANGNYDTTKSSTPIANFDSLDKFLDFMVARLTPNVRRILFGENGNAPLGLPKYYACYWTPATSENPNISPEYFDANLNEFKLLIDTVKKGLKSANEVQLNGDATNNVTTANQQQIQQITNGNTPAAVNNLNTTTTVTPVVCLPPSITSFSPATGVNGTILTLIGNDFDGVTGITINGVTTTTGITINSSTSMVVVVPFSNTTVPQNNVITVKGVYGDGSTTTTFNYNPLQTSAAPPTIAPSIPPNSNTQPQQTGPITMIGQTQNGVTLLGNASIDVVINPQLLGGYTFLPTNVYPKMSFKVTQNNVTNNTTTTYTVFESGLIDLSNTYFTSPAQFQMNQANILSVITANWQTPPADCDIICTFTITASSLVTLKQDTQSFKLNILL